MENIHLKTIGVVHSPRTEPVDDYWKNVISTIQLDDKQFGEEVTRGLEDFSHIQVIFYMNQVKKEKIEYKARHPRNETSWPKVGIFSQRGKNRPNQIGVSYCKLLKVEGLCLTVQSLDAIDGTPVLDIKPYTKQFDPQGTIKEPQWMQELMTNYYK